MRNFVSFVFLLGIVFSFAAKANNEQVDGRLLIKDLSKDVKFVFTRPLTMQRQDSERVGRIYGASFNKSLKLSSVQTLDERSVLSAARIIIYGAQQDDAGIFFDCTAENKPNRCPAYFYFDSPIKGRLLFESMSVSELIDLTGGLLKIVWDDPERFELMPGLDNSVALDIFMTRIVNAIKDEDFKLAVSLFKSVEKTKGLKPDVFWLQYAEASEKAGDKEKAREIATDYLKRHGRTGTKYKEMVALLGRLSP